MELSTAMSDQSIQHSLFHRIQQFLCSVKYFVCKKVTLEPVIFGYYFIYCMQEGSQMTTDLLIGKVCKFEMKFPEELCNNLASKNHTNSSDAASEVQRRANNFEVR